MRLQDYSQKYNKLCLEYSGNYKHYLRILQHIRKFTPEFTIACREELLYLVDEPKITNFEKNNFGKVYRIIVEIKENILYTLIKEYKPILIEEKKVNSSTIVFCPNGDFPAKSIAPINGKNILLAYKEDDIPTEAKVVIGVSGEAFWKATLDGIPSILVDNSCDSQLYTFLTNKKPISVDQLPYHLKRY